MKATLEFNLDDPDDTRAHFRCVKALDMALALYEVQELLYKLPDEDPTRQALADILEHRDILVSELVI